MRIAGNAQDAAWALDEVLNPGRQKKPAAEVPYDTDETRRFVHFGPFKDRAQELEHIAFWKNWYQTKAPQ